MLLNRKKVLKQSLIRAFKAWLDVYLNNSRFFVLSVGVTNMPRLKPGAKSLSFILAWPSMSGNKGKATDWLRLAYSTDTPPPIDI